MMTEKKALDLALEALDGEARKLYQSKKMYEDGFVDQKNRARRYDEIREAQLILKGLGAQGRLGI